MSGIPDAIHVETGEVGMMKRVESKSPGMSLPGTIATLSNVLVGGSVLLPYSSSQDGVLERCFLLWAVYWASHCGPWAS